MHDLLCWMRHLILLLLQMKSTFYVMHSHKILPIQEGYPRGVRIPPLALAGFYSGRMAVVHLLYLLDIPSEVCKGLTKCRVSRGSPCCIVKIL